jgi:Fe-S-cluster-containing dehydrogenase component
LRIRSSILRAIGHQEYTTVTYVIAEPCINVKDVSCVPVCPVDRIYSTDQDDMYYINKNVAR